MNRTQFAPLWLFALALLPTIATGQRVDPISLPAAPQAGFLAPTSASGREPSAVGSDGSHSNVVRGAEIGFVVGLVVGAVLGATVSGCCGREGHELKTVAIVANGLIGGAIGALVGAFIGSRHHSQDSVSPVSPTISAPSN